ncbi:MAG TPA: flagellar FlbD family protein [Methylomirabilota bacterium]|nr:flagellar FlbD family protein [Methylomirabilota bacterium]
MIKVTRFNRELVVLNAELIESVEATPDTVITLTSGKKLLVSEPVELVVERILEYRRAIHHPAIAGADV